MQDNFEFPGNLQKNILFGIRQEERRRARRMLAISAVIAPVSLVGMIWSAQYAFVAFYQSSFYTYFSLLFSDPDIIALYWREFILALVEALPVVGIVLCLVAIGVFLMSLQLFARNIRFGLTPSFTN